MSIRLMLVLAVGGCFTDPVPLMLGTDGGEHVRWTATKAASHATPGVPKKCVPFDFHQTKDVNILIAIGTDPAKSNESGVGLLSRVGSDYEFSVYEIDANPGMVAQGLVTGDYDGDGLEDVLVLTGECPDNFLLLSGEREPGEESGRLRWRALPKPDRSVASFSGSSLDLNRDGLSDVVIGNHGSNLIYHGSGQGDLSRVVDSVTLPIGFKEQSRRYEANATETVLSGDLDGDGDIDLVTAGPVGHGVQVYANDGTGLLRLHEMELPQGVPPHVSGVALMHNPVLNTSVIVCAMSDPGTRQGVIVAIDAVRGLGGHAWVVKDSSGNPIRGVWSDAIAGDLDGDGVDEVVALDSGSGAGTWVLEWSQGGGVSAHPIRSEGAAAVYGTSGCIVSPMGHEPARFLVCAYDAVIEWDVNRSN